MYLFWQNLRYSLRSMVRNPAFTAVALITLALGIGANTAIFSIVNAFLLRPLPYPEPEQLVALYAVPTNLDRSGVSYPQFLALREQNPFFSNVTALFETTFNWTGTATALEVQGAMASEKYFETFGSAPLLGRTFLHQEHLGDGHVVLLSEDFWYQRLGGRTNILGETLTLDGLPYTIIGVMPRRAPDFTPEHRTSLWIPLEPNRPMYSMNPLNHYLRVFGRLDSGIKLQQAQAKMGFLAKRVSGAYPVLTDGLVIEPIREVFARQLRAGVLLLQGTVILLLLITCANIANLFMIRATVRLRELAVRTALGATPAQLVRQTLIDSLLITALGGVMGLLLATWTKSSLLALWPANVPRPYELGIDWRVLGFNAMLSLGTGVLFSLGPAWISSRVAPLQFLNQGASQTGVGVGQNRFFNFVVISEFALAVILTVGAGLMIKSFTHLQQVDPGFQAKGVLTARIELPAYEYAQGLNMFRGIMRDLEALPGVEAVGASTILPLSSEEKPWQILEVEGHTIKLGQEPSAVHQLVSPGYFKTMHIPLLAGRPFTEKDTREAPLVVIVNQALARRFWGNDTAVGKHLNSGAFINRQEIVGVVADVRGRALDKPDELEIYLSYAAFKATGMTVAITSNLSPAVLTPSVREVVGRYDKGLAIRFQTMEDVVENSVAERRMAALIPSLFALCGLALSSMGIYGVTSYVTARRTREIGIRIVLGAGPREVLMLMLRHGISLTLAGIGIGVLGALALTRLLARWLYGVRSHDSQTFVLACAVLTIVATIATYLPARRATRVDPIVALRQD